MFLLMEKKKQRMKDNIHLKEIIIYFYSFIFIYFLFFNLFLNILNFIILIIQYYYLLLC